MTKGEDQKKTCFVIGPIGKTGSPERSQADWLLKGIIKPVLTEAPFNFEVIRADEMTEPGLITSDVIGAVIESDLAIADLTGHNPNAFYELATRHMEQGPVIHMAKEGVDLPFDIKDYRAIFYRLDDFDDLEGAKTDLKAQVEAVIAKGYKPNNPIITARGVLKLKRSASPQDQIVAELRRDVERLDAIVRQIDSRTATNYADAGLGAIAGLDPETVRGMVEGSALSRARTPRRRERPPPLSEYTPLSEYKSHDEQD